MRREWRCAGILLLMILFVLTGCQEEVQSIRQPTLIVKDLNGVDPKEVYQYEMDLTFDPVNAMIYVHQRVNYINNEEITLDRVYFHLYPNAFRKKETAPFLFDDFEEAYPQGFQPGYIDVQKATVDGKKVAYQLEGEGETIMKIPLPAKLEPKERTTIVFDYMVKLPPAQERFGYSESTYNFGNWYPIAAVYDKTGWNLDPYYPIGDPFYSDVSNYRVTIKTPKDFVVAASGNILKEEIHEDRKIWQIEAKLMRDFAWVTSKEFELIEKNVEGTVLKMYFIKDKNLENEIIDFATQVGEDSLKIFNRVYGKYPYGQYSVVQTHFPSGMEYPGIVFIGQQFYNKSWQDYLEVIIVHETAHQWWYGVVGNDEIDEAWLDESMAAYSEVIYMKEMFGEEAGKKYHQFANEDGYREVAASIYDKVVLKPLYAFEGWEDYGSLVYSKGAMFLNDIYERYGADKFYKIMKRYYQKYRFRNATTADFQKICEEVIGNPIKTAFQKWLVSQ